MVASIVSKQDWTSTELPRRDTGVEDARMGKNSPEPKLNPEKSHAPLLNLMKYFLKSG